MTMITMNQGKS